MIQFRYAEIIHRLERPNQFANPIKTRIRAICGEGCNLQLSFALCTHRTHILPEKHEYSIVCWYILMLRDLPTKQKLLGKYQNHRMFLGPWLQKNWKYFISSQKFKGRQCSYHMISSLLSNFATLCANCKIAKKPDIPERISLRGQNVTAKYLHSKCANGLLLQKPRFPQKQYRSSNSHKLSNLGLQYK